VSSTERRRGGRQDLSGFALLGGIAFAALVGVIMYAGLQLGAMLTGEQLQLPTENPLVLPIHVVKGEVVFSTTALVCSGVLALLLLILVGVVAALVLRRRKPNRDVDRAARHMGSGKDLDRLSRPQVTEEAKRLGVRGSVGVFLGHSVIGRRELLADYESTEVNIWGPRTGKTTSRAVPVILEATGAVLATSNRRDLIDAVRDPREALGRVHVFDPQQIIGEPPTWWWNPLSYITSGPAGPEVKAQALAGIFAASAIPPDAKEDAFFDPEGTELVGHLLHAAAANGMPISQVYLWVTEPSNADPARLLDTAGYPMSAAAVRSVVNAPDKQRQGVYGAAKRRVSFLTNTGALEWITPGRAPGREQFDAEAFAGASGTLLLVSREGRGSLSALTTALTAAVCEAAEHRASRSPGGRLASPMTVVLDEVANVCRWPDLPNLYSHFGGRGIYLLAILQSWSQGVEVWGPRGMAKLWSAASVRVYGGGASEVDFLRELSTLIGHYRPQTTSATTSRSGRSVNYSQGHEEVLDVSDLGALRRGRVIVFPSGVRPVLVEPRPWYSTGYADTVRASIKAHDPAAEVTLAEHDVAPAGVIGARLGRR